MTDDLHFVIWQVTMSIGKVLLDVSQQIDNKCMLCLVVISVDRETQQVGWFFSTTNVYSVDNQTNRGSAGLK